MQNQHTIIRAMASLAVAIVLLCTGSAGRADEPKVVRMGINPVFDYQPWVIAHTLGLDKELGIDLQTVNVTTTAAGIAAMRQGSLEATASSQVAAFAFYKSIPTLRTWIALDQFKGFIVVGRKGQTETFSALSAKVGPAEAKKQILQSLKGKSFALNVVNYENLVKAAVDQVGLTLNDVKLTAFPDDAKAALAFEKGVGDFYMGSLPQQIKLLADTDKYVNVGGQEILGPAGLWFSGMIGLEPWLSANQDTVMKLLAVWYRTSRYINERPDLILPMWTKVINERAAASFTVADVKSITTLIQYRNIQDTKATVYNPRSEFYWRNSVTHYVAQDKGNLPSDFASGKYNSEETIFDAFIKSDALVRWVDAPLK